jgi:hypothetical protein
MIGLAARPRTASSTTVHRPDASRLYESPRSSLGATQTGNHPSTRNQL